MYYIYNSVSPNPIPAFVYTYMQSHGFSQSVENMEIGSVNSIGHN